MASVFDIFGEINLESKAFEGSLRTVTARLKATDSALDQTISKSNKLGDTSATVARRYDKLSEGITAQRQKLLDNALAFEKGEINATKFASVVTSVDKATTSLNSRLKDAKARLTELDETNLTHFQQQIQGAVRSANAQLETFRQGILAQQGQGGTQTSSLFGRLSAQQKTQLSFQLNDIITGLASGQNPLQILAQQGGQIVQIFQQGKAAQEGVAAATTTAATAQAAFAASSKTSAVSQAQVAVSSAATATSMEAAAASSTILGASVVSLGAVLAAGLVAIIAVWKATKDIQEAAEKRLKNELAVTATLNEQLLIQQKFKERLATEAGERKFSAFAQSDDIAGLQIALANITRERDAAVNARTAEMQRRLQLRDALLPTGADLIGWVGEAAENPAQKKLREQQEGQISQLTARIAELRQVNTSNISEFVRGIPERAAKANEERLKAAAEAEKKYAEDRKKMVDEAIKKAKEWADHVKKAGEAVAGIFASTSNNPFVKIFTDAEDAIQRMREATKGLGSDLQNTLANLIRNQAETKSFAQSLDNALKASNLRQEAKEFMGGGITEASVRQRALNRIFPNYFSAEARERDLQEAIKAVTKEDFQANIDRQLKAIGANNISGLSDDKLAAFDKKVIALTQGAEGKLDYGTSKLASDARLREAGRLDTEKEDAKKLIREQNIVLADLTKAIQDGSIVRIINEDPKHAKVSSQPRKADSNAFFSR